LAAALFLLSSCSDKEEKKQLGEACTTHEECASGLCTVSRGQGDSGPSDGGAVTKKRCTETSI
jgi:hypothetical protein